MPIPKSITNIEQKMENMDENSLRYQILKSAKDFKTSWIHLGQALYSVWKDKHYKDWGYNKFEVYTAREIGIRKETAVKLLKSYYFLEKEEPEYLRENYVQSAEASKVPNFEAVNALRLAKNKKILEAHEYNNLKKDILEKGIDVREVKKDLTALIKQREELEPEEARQRKKVATVRRFLGILKALRTEIEISKMVSSPVIKEVNSLINKLEAEIS